jgi:hypothetical protein
MQAALQDRHGAAHQVWQGADQGDELLVDKRRDDENDAGHHTREADADHRSRQGARPAETLEPYDHGVEQIGRRRADQERHQHLAQRVEQRTDDDGNAQPNQQALERRHGDAPMRDARRPHLST